MDLSNECSIFLLLFISSFLFFGCATPAAPVKSSKPVETVDQKMDAAQKVLGGMAGREVSREEFKRVARDIEKDEAARSAVRKIIGADGAPVIKYSPVTGKHYSGDLEFDPETGVKLEVLAE